MRHQESSQETRDHRMTPVKTSAVSSHSGARGKDGAVVGDSYRSFQNFKCYYLVTSLAILGASPYSGSWWWTGRPGVRRFMGSQRVGHDWTTDLIWSVAQMVKNLPSMQATWVQPLGWKDPLEKGMATHSSILAWRIPWTEESGRLQFMGSQRVGHNWATSTSGNSVVKTSPSNVGGAGLIPDEEAKIPLGPKNIKQK